MAYPNQISIQKSLKGLKTWIKEQIATYIAWNIRSHSMTYNSQDNCVVQLTTRFLLKKDYSDNDCLHVVLNKIPHWILHDLCIYRCFIIEVYTIHKKVLAIISRRRIGWNQILIKFITWVYSLGNTYLSVFIYP